ncbi:MAG: hypothetical protein IH958_05400 [Chloroflexi bacterium]|nr:hypothetical protein [Chloroflexota bacterium]
MGGLWRWWTESWRSARRARGLYLVMAGAFGVLAIGAGITADAAVAALAGVAAVVTGALAFFAPQLARWMNPPPDEP